MTKMRLTTGPHTEILVAPNNWVENRHLPFGRRWLAMLSFRQMKALPELASVHAFLHNHITQARHLVDRQTFKQRRLAALAEWQSLAS